MNYWLVKTEPEAYSWDDMERDGVARWDGVRNFAARNNLKTMQIGDEVMIYHSITDKAIVGYARVVKEHYPDPTTDDERWVAVDMSPVKKLDKLLTLAQIKAEPRLQSMQLLKIGRLSVSQLTREEFEVILELGTNL
jgi:predicted RNA-binding protein with PUA-like domain